eukprot:9952071-Alexandrium_andersonii.AAC.1
MAYGWSHIASSPGGSAPLDPPEKRLRRARRPVLSSPSDSTRKMTPNPPDETFWVEFEAAFGTA